MSNITQFFGSDSVERKKNRRIFTGEMVGLGVTTGGFLWPVPPGVTEVEVHCWGAGGDGGFFSQAPLPTGGTVSYTGGGGGGGGYVTHVFPVTSSDRLLIICGAAPGGTSSVSVPTQSPISPISATGGSIGVQTSSSPVPLFPIVSSVGLGGVGSYTIAPGISTTRTFSASGGNGGGVFNAPNPAAAPVPANVLAGAGGAAGSPFGPGGDGGVGSSGGGGGIGGPGGSPGPLGVSIYIPTDMSLGSSTGGGSLGGAVSPRGGRGIRGYREVFPYVSPIDAVISNNVSNINTDDWFYVDEILGSGGNGSFIHGGPGGGGSGFPGSGDGGILGGAAGNGRAGFGGGGSYIPTGPTGTRGGRGGAGLVIIYW